MKNIFIITVILILSVNSTTSKEIKLFFKNLHRTPYAYYENVCPLYKITFDTLRRYSFGNPNENKILPVIYPDMKNSKDTAVIKQFFTGWENPAYKRICICLVGNYKADTTYIWVDLNNNLNFSDDNAFHTLTKGSSLYIPFFNSKNQEGKFIYRISKKVYKDSAEKYEFSKEYSSNDNISGFISVEPDYWFSETRLNILSCDTTINGEKVQIALMDWNCNGLYDDIDTINPDNFQSDRILKGKYGENIISFEPSDGAVILLPETLIKINNQVYSVKKVEPSGKYMILEESNKPYNLLSVGDSLPDLEFILFSNEKRNIKDFIVNGKYNFIDIWAYWCKGCSYAFTKLMELDSLYSEKINIIGLHDYQSDEDIARSFIRKIGAKWTQGFLNPSISKKLLFSGSYPFYILITPDGKFLKFNISLEEFEEILKKSE